MSVCNRVLTLSSGKAHAVLMALERLALASVRYRLTHRCGAPWGSLCVVAAEDEAEEEELGVMVAEEKVVDALSPSLLVLLPSCKGMMGRRVEAAVSSWDRDGSMVMLRAV
ncbi:hypothetical protein SEPCBS57363_006459 [Sporothrix epigloea]|uniref:Uncharacterized protein n=1 Tax=Sporothrix epigloea TaxID=1892477 RepID=A0ABP0E6G5_9PEZI